MSEPTYHTKKNLSENLVYLGLSILELSKIVICEFWYDYVKLKYKEKAKLYHIDTDSFNETDHYKKKKNVIV